MYVCTVYTLLWMETVRILEMFWLIDSWSQWIATPVPKPDNTLATLLKKIRETLLPDRLPRLTRTSQRFLLFLVLLLLSVIFLWTLPSQPSPPRTIEEGNPTETIDVPGRDDGGGVSFSWLPNFLSNNYLPIILSLFLAILAVLWRSMIGDSLFFHLVFCHLTLPKIYQSHQYIYIADPKETGAVTHPQKLDAGTDQAKLDAFVWLIEINCNIKYYHKIYTVISPWLSFSLFASDTNSPVTKVIPKEKLKNNGIVRITFFASVHLILCRNKWWLFYWLPILENQKDLYLSFSLCHLTLPKPLTYICCRGPRKWSKRDRCCYKSSKTWWWYRSSERSFHIPLPGWLK